MPAKNVLKQDNSDSYYHVYARGINKQDIFLEHADYIYFQKILSRYLSKKPHQDKVGASYPHYTNKVELNAFCLMKNHFHLLIFQSEIGAMTKLMRSIMTSYSMYFNLKYKHYGPVFESRYKAVKIDHQNYLDHISRYIHLNPRYWQRYQYSSLQYYINKPPEWLRPGKIMDLFDNLEKYIEFLSDYEEHKQMLSELKHELADQ